MFAKNITEIKLFIKELDGKDRSDRNTYILVRNCRESSLFCDVHLTELHKTKSTYFYLTVKLR
jgi:NifB/MoaA-like Fe-S oxidoreductase